VRRTSGESLAARGLRRSWRAVPNLQIAMSRLPCHRSFDRSSRDARTEGRRFAPSGLAVAVVLVPLLPIHQNVRRRRRRPVQRRSRPPLLPAIRLVIGRGEQRRECHHIQLGIEHQFQPADRTSIQSRWPWTRLKRAMTDRRATGGTRPRHARLADGLQRVSRRLDLAVDFLRQHLLLDAIAAHLGEFVGQFLDAVKARSEFGVIDSASHARIVRISLPACHWQQRLR